MMELEPYFFDNLVAAKQLWDAGHSEKFFENCGSIRVDSEEYYEIFWDAINSVFEGVCAYYNEEKEIEVIVCFDPLFEQFFSLCAQYELRKGISREDNPMRHAGQVAVHDSFGFTDYSCDWWLYDESHGRPRFVILMACEFCSHHLLPGAVVDARNELEAQIVKLINKLNELDAECEKVTPKEFERKEAA